MHCIINRNDIENIKILIKLKGRMISWWDTITVK
jgi:hypothetical protein